MVGLKCFNISYSYQMQTGEMSVLLVDIETGCSAVFYNPYKPDLAIRNDIQEMLRSYAENTNSFPQTVMYYGAYEYGDDIIYLHTYDDAIFGVSAQKFYACCIYTVPEQGSFTFVDRCDGQQILIQDAPDELIDQVVGFVNHVYAHEYREFDPDGCDSVILGGVMADIGDGFATVQFNDMTVFGTMHDVYTQLATSLLRARDSGY